MIRVLIVDDSALLRGLLRAILAESTQIEVCGEACDAYDAREKIKQLEPHVITLDVEMPKMDGISFLRHLMHLHPIPTVMLSVRTEQGSQLEVEALALGAVACVHKPNGEDIASIGAEIIQKVILASHYRVHNHPGEYPSLAPQLASVGTYIAGRLIALGASTGGIPAIERVLSMLPLDCPPVLIVQHIPAGFSTIFATRINKKYQINICEAYDGQAIEAGHVYLAPGDEHLRVVKKAGRYYCQLHKGALVCYQRPAVDVLFESVAQATQGNASAALLTGMGTDGAEGLLSMRRQGCFTLIQDQASCTVWGMPGEAAALGAANETLHLNHIAARLIESCYEKNSKSA
ncbi:MAG: chemotaxis response regulator protein-glutamate methylesterase [Bermanella sp.]